MKDISIHGENATSIAAILEYIQLPDHPFHEQARVQAAAFLENERLAKMESGKRMMQEQMKHISPEEWSSIVD